MKKILIVTLLVLVVIIAGFTAYSWEEVETDRNTGHWVVQEQTDPLTDELEVQLALLCNKVIEETNPTTAISLIFRSTTESIHIFILGNFQIGSKKIVYRFDDGEVKENTWLMASNYKGLFFPKKEEDIENFVKKLTKAQEFIIGVYPSGQERSTFVFDLKGLKNALLPYLEEFGWEDLEETIKEGMEETEE